MTKLYELEFDVPVGDHVEVDIEDGGQAIIFQPLDLESREDSTLDCFFFRLQSWDEERKHEFFNSLRGKKLRLTIEEIDTKPVRDEEWYARYEVEVYDLARDITLQLQEKPLMGVEIMQGLGFGNEEISRIMPHVISDSQANGADRQEYRGAMVDINILEAVKEPLRRLGGF